MGKPGVISEMQRHGAARGPGQRGKGDGQMKQKPCRPAIATWWEACIYNAEDPLIPVEVFAFTDNTVTILDERILTHTGYVKRER